MVMFNHLSIGLIRVSINISAMGFYKQTGQALYQMAILGKDVFDFVGVRSSPQPTVLRLPN